MKLLKDSILKMEWDADKAYFTKKGFINGKTFIFAGQDYTSKDGSTVSVFFTPDTAFVWGAIGDLWSNKEVKDWISKNPDSEFPTIYDEYIAVIDYGDDYCNMELLTDLGIEEYAQDIENRIKDVRPYGEEREDISF